MIFYGVPNLKLRKHQESMWSTRILDHSQARNQGGKAPPTKYFAPPSEIVFDTIWNYWTKFETFGPSEETLRSPWCPKLVTGLNTAHALSTNQPTKKRNHLALQICTTPHATSPQGEFSISCSMTAGTHMKNDHLSMRCKGTVANW